MRLHLLTAAERNHNRCALICLALEGIEPWPMGIEIGRSEYKPFYRWAIGPWHDRWASHGSAPSFVYEIPTH